MKVIYTYDGQIYTVYDVKNDQSIGQIEFLVFMNGNWSYQPSVGFIPIPN